MTTPGPGPFGGPPPPQGVGITPMSVGSDRGGPVPPTPKRMYGDKALKTMGISAQQLMHNFLGQGSGGKRGTLSFYEYSLFWSEMSRVQQTCMYLKLLIIDLMDVLDKKKDSGKRSYPIQAIVNTINFLAIHFPIEGKGKVSLDLKNTLKKWESNRREYANNHVVSSAEEVIRTIAKRLIENKPAIDTLIIQCSTLHSHDEFKELSCVIKVPTMHGREIRSGEFSQVYSFLKRQAARSPEILKEILNVSLLQMLTLPQQIKMSAKLSETSLLALLHMLKQFVSYWRLPDPSFTSKAVSVLKQFYLWPSPCGEATRDLLITFKTESLAPGNELLQRFAHESTVPKVIARNIEGNVEVCRPVYYLIDENIQTSKIANLMFLRSYADEVKDANEEGDPNAYYWEEMEHEVNTPGLSPKTMALLMLSVISHDVEVLPEDLKNARHLSADDVYSLFDQVVTILHGAQEYGSVEEAKTWRVEGLSELKTEIARLAAQNHGVTGFQPVHLPESLPANFMPDLPKLVHLSVPTKIAYNMPTRAFIDENMYTPIPRTPVHAHLKAIVEKFSYLADPDNPARIRLVIAGGDTLLHTVVIAYMSLRQIPRKLDGIELQFFLVPFRENHMASFIARHDSWYNRHIYVPFSPNYLLPMCQPNQNNEDFSDLGIPPPAAVWRENVEHFVREADNVATIQLFKCEAWLNLPMSTELPDQSIPFCQRLEISSDVTKTRLQRKVADEINNKNIATTVELTIDLEPVDVMGVRTRFKKEDVNLIYQSIVMNNVPHERDACHPADPRTPWLETYCKVSEQQRYQKKDKRSPYSIDKKLHVTKAVITAAKPEGSFDVLIDGVIFGQFQKIVVTPIVINEQDPESEHISFPLHTFFPLDI